MGRASDSSLTFARCDDGGAPATTNDRPSNLRRLPTHALFVLSRSNAVRFKPMDINKMLEELRTERMMIEESIIALGTGLPALGGGKRRGRPPQWMAAAGAKRRGAHQARRINLKLRGERLDSIP